MGKPYKKELNDLSTTYQYCKDVDIADLVKQLTSSSNLPLYTIGSGGSFSMAELHSSLHRNFCDSTAKSCTPMEVPFLNKNKNKSVWFLSASGNNIDINRAFKHTVLVEPKHVAVLLGSKNSKLAKLKEKHQYVSFFEYSIPTGKDGFLATNSLFFFSVIMYRAYCIATKIEQQLPRDIEALLRNNIQNYGSMITVKQKTKELWEKEVLHLVYSPELRSVAIDVESKFVEAGLGSVLLADIRNFAHGRHHWFSKNTSNSAILFLNSVEDFDLAKRTLDLLPELPKFQFTFKNNHGQELLSGMLLSFYFCYWKGLYKNIDPGKPRVPNYGSKIYRLTAKSGFKTSMQKKEAAINRKVSNNFGVKENYDSWDRAHDVFVKNISKKNIGAIVLDFDGTIVDARFKTDPPEEKICNEIVRLLDLGLKIGFATGRGKSIRLQLQKVLPKKYWSSILIGYYNGSEIGTLADNSVPNGEDNCNEELEGFIKLLNDNSSFNILDLKITKRQNQITIEPRSSLPETFLWDIINYEKDINNKENIKVLRSSHSIDIVLRTTSKLSVLKLIQSSLPDEKISLSIGDRGKWPGNDYELLDNNLSLSVDEVSSSKDKCWNICPSGVKGTQGALYYLQRIKNSNGKFLYK